MSSRFKGFNEDQFKRIAQTLGYTGPLEGFNNFLARNPDKMKMFGQTLSSLDFGQKGYAAGGMVAGSGTSGPAGTGAKKTGKVKQDDQQYVAYPRFSDPARKVTRKARNSSSIPATKGKTLADAAATQTRPNQFIDNTLGRVNPTAARVRNIALPTQTPSKDAETVDPSKVSGKVRNQTRNLEAVTGSPQAKATVQGQLEELYRDFDAENPPAWAAGAVRTAEQRMAERGLGQSSMAGAAVTQAAMESALPIAAQDAQTFAAFQAENLNRRQQVKLAKFQTRVQSIFTDQAAINASKQFNAQSQNQMQQFYDSMRNSVKVARANIRNDVRKFNKNMRSAREQFNSTNAIAIRSANKAWRQRVATENTAAENAVNQLNASLLTGMQQNAFDAYVQFERDEMSYINEALNRTFTESENQRDRLVQIALGEMRRDLSTSLQDDEQQFEVWESVGRAAQSVLSSDIGQTAIKSIFGF